MALDTSMSMMQHIYDNEKKNANSTYFTQPMGNDVVIDTTYGEMMQEARKVAQFLKDQGFGDGDKIGMISKNCDKFITTEVGIWMAGCTTVAIFPNTNAETVNYCLTDAEAKFLFVGKLDDYDTLVGGFPDVPKIAFPLAPEAARSAFPHWEDMIKDTAPMEGEPDRGRDDLALFIYTSGSTGKPKGVMHAFGPIADAVHGILNANKKYMTHNTRMLSYLPLAHVFERAYIECTSLVTACHVFFAEAITTFKDDLVRAQPTVFISVPRLWVKFQQGVFKKFSESTLDILFKIPGVGSLIKGKILKGLGLNKVKLAGSGSAPIPAPLLAWYRRLGLNLYEGYAMSEDFAYSHLSKKGASEVGYVGVPYEGVEVKIHPETSEILINSPGKMVGYWKLEEKTKESFDENGFFKTGDRGERKQNGLLKITGRLKEIFKTSKGKYVSPAPIENLLNADAMVELSLVGGSGMPQPYVQIVVAEDLRAKINDEEVKQKIETRITALLEEVNAKIEHHERMDFAVIFTGEWSPENGMLTPTLKIKRSAIEASVEDKLEDWYAQKKKIIWN